MTETANSLPLVTSEAILPFQLYSTHPSTLVYHWIWDYELGKLVNISRPITLGMAFLFAGAFLGLLPSLIAALEKIGKGAPLSPGDLFLCMLFAICMASALICGFFAYRGQRDAEEICADVRARNLSPVGGVLHTPQTAGAEPPA